MTTQSYPIQGNQFFQKVENTVLSSINVEDALNNSEVLVTRVAKGRTLSSVGDQGTLIPVYTREPVSTDTKDNGDVLVLPAGALVTRVLVGPDSTVEDATKRITPVLGTTFQFHLVDDATPTTKQEITAQYQPGVDFNKVLARSVDSSQVTTFPNVGAVVLDIGTDDCTVDGTLVVEVHYTMPQF